MKRCLLLIFLLASCEKPAHPVEEKAALILDAIKFGDTDTLIKHHIESTPQAVFCTAEFERTLKKVEAINNAQNCKAVKSISESEFNALPDEEKLVTRIARFVCENKEKTCHSFSKEIYKQSLENVGWVGQVKGYKIKRTLGDEGDAVVYVEYAGAFGVRTGVLKFKKISSNWFLVTGLLD